MIISPLFFIPVTKKYRYDKINLMKKMQTYLKVCFLCLLLFSCFLLSLGQLDDQDTWFHLKTGEWIVTHLSVPHNQLFSYPIKGISWLNHSWLFQILIFSVFKFLGGVNALIFFKAVLVSLILWIALKGFLIKVNVIFFLLTSWLVSGLFLERTPVRPELISALFLALYLYVLFNKKNIWWLVFIQSIWVNTHGYSVFGPIVLSLYILSESIRHKIKLPFDWNKERYFNSRAECNKSFAVLAITAFLFLLSPYGLDNIRYPFFVIKNFLQGTNNFYHVDELVSLGLSDILFTKKYILLTCAIFLYMVSLLFNIRKISLFNIVICTSFFFIYCAAQRNGIFFAIVACFSILDNFKTENLEGARKYFNFHYADVFSMIIACLLVFFILNSQFIKFKNLNREYVYSEDLKVKSYLFGIDAGKYPEKAADFMLENRIKGPIFNSFDISGYLVWRMYPSYQMFIDGRIGLHAKKFVDDFMRSTVDFEKWQQLSRKYGFNAVLLDYSSIDVYYHLIRSLYKSDEWRLVYFGDNAVIFVKNNPINKEIISKYGISLEGMQNAGQGVAFILDKRPLLYPMFFLNRARFFMDAMDMPESALKDLKKAEAINPECYEAYQLTGYVYFQMRMFKEAKEAFEKSLQISPYIAEPYVNLGSVAAKTGSYEKAYFFYKQALRLDKGNKAARYNLNTLIRQGFD